MVARRRPLRKNKAAEPFELEQPLTGQEFLDLIAFLVSQKAR
jgi:hypothetical protein